MKNTPLASITVLTRFFAGLSQRLPHIRLFFDDFVLQSTCRSYPMYS